MATTPTTGRTAGLTLVAMTLVVQRRADAGADQEAALAGGRRDSHGLLTAPPMTE
jgi:hypothetical protein